MKRMVLVIFLVSVMIISGCVQETPPATPGSGNPGGGTEPTATNMTSMTPPSNGEPLSVIHVQADRSLSPKECSDRGLGDRVIFIYSSTCPACKMTKPALLEAASETGKTVEEINLVTDSKELDELAILPYYIPTTIVDCEVLVGPKQKFEFRDIMEMM